MGLPLLCVCALFATVAAQLTDNAAPTSMKKILNTRMKPASIPAEEQHGNFWRMAAGYTLKAKLQEKPNFNKAKNGILFIGDGMSQATIMAARTFYGQMASGPGEEAVLDFEKFPVSGLARTYCIDAQVPDSACTATSYLTGVKTKSGVIGIDGNVTRGLCNSQLHEPNWSHSIATWALEQGLDVGVVTTTRITHASPAGVYAHIADREWESDADLTPEAKALGCKDIAYQLIMENPGKQIKVLMGGGRWELLSNDTQDSSAPGKRLDGLDLTEEWHKHKQEINASHLYVSDRQELLQASNSGDLPEYLLGLFQNDHMDYHLKAQNQPSLEEMVEVAIKMLSRSPNGYFLFVEGGRIDHAHHESKARLALDETVEYSKAVKKAKSLTSEDDTLIVVSADHAHTMTVSGYPSRGNDILNVVDTALALDGLPYTTISYANGKASSFTPTGRVDVTLHDLFQSKDLDYSYPSLVPLDSETHGGEDVAVYASGPFQHLFTASYEQNVIPHMMAYAMCLTDDKHAKCENGSSAASTVKPLVFLTVILAVRFILD